MIMSNVNIEEIVLINSKTRPLNLELVNESTFLDYCSKHKSKRIYITNICHKCKQSFSKYFCYTYDNAKKDYLNTCPNCIRESTLLKTLGVTNISQLERTKAKKRQTTKEHFGTEYPLQSKIIKQKCIKTCQDKYNVINVSQIDEIKRKKEQTCLEHYGAKYIMQTEEGMKNYIEQSRLKYNTKYPVQNEQVKNKILNSNKRNHNGKHYAQTKAHKLNMQKMWKDKHDEIIAKRDQTLMNRYNSTYILTYNNSYLFNNIYFDSSWELIFYIYHLDKGDPILRNTTNYFTYYKDGKKHKYYPDFVIYNQYYEVKGEQFIMRYKNGNVKCLKNFSNNSLQKEKYICMKKNKVILITYKEIDIYTKYIIDTYGKNYLKQFKCS